MPNLADYRDFLDSKRLLARASGIEPPTLRDSLFPWQCAVVEWALRQGRAALFADTGLGKTRMELEWADRIAAHTGKSVLLLTPLAVAHQFVDEACKIGVQAQYARAGGESDAQVVITNYDRLDKFDSSMFSGVVLDESSILKNYTGKTKQRLIEAFQATPYKLCGTATPAPNDHMELGNHAELLGIMPSNEMLMRFFINDTMKAGGYRLKAPAVESFWNWVASWAACVGKPSDIGYDDTGYILPPLHIHQETIDVDHRRAWESGQMFLGQKRSATGLWKEKEATLQHRCERAAELVTADDDTWVVWCSTDAESTLLTSLIPGAIEVRGSEPLERKEAKLKAFGRGEFRVIVTKTKIAGLGLNWQHASKQAFTSLTFSFESFYQGYRRSYRFGQTRPVDIWVIVAETEGNILSAIQQKHAQHREMQVQMIRAMKRTGLLAQRASSLVPYRPAVEMQLPAWI